MKEKTSCKMHLGVAFLWTARTLERSSLGLY